MITTLAEKGGASLTPLEADQNIVTLNERTKPGWRDNVIEIKIRQGPNEPVITTFRGGILLPAFVHTDVQSGFANFHIDHDYAPGTPIYPHIHWAVDSDLIGTVRWGFEWTFAKGHQQMAFGPTQTFYVEQTTTGVPYMHYISEASDEQAIPGDLIETDGFVLLRIFRDATHPNDTFEDQIFGIAADLHYQASQATTPFKRPDFFTGP